MKDAGAEPGMETCGTAALAQLVELEVQAAALVLALRQTLPATVPPADRTQVLTLAADLRSALERLSAQSEVQLKTVQAEQGFAPDD